MKILSDNAVSKTELNDLLANQTVLLNEWAVQKNQITDLKAMLFASFVVNIVVALVCKFV
jgi:hypothetical protein